MKLPHLLLILILSISTFSCSNDDIVTDEEKKWLENNPGLKVAVFPKYPPYQYINSDGEIDGVFIDFFSLIEKKINYKFTKVYYKNWEPIIDDAKNGKLDILLEIQNTKERRSFLNFTPPLLTNPHVIVGKKNIPYNTDITYFYGKKISVGRKYAIHEYLKVNHDELLIDAKLNDLIGIESLQSGEVEAYIGQKAIAAYLLDQMNSTDFKIIGEVNYTNSLGFATKKELKILNKIITKAVKSISDIEKQEIIGARTFIVIKPFYKSVRFWVFFTLVALFFLVLIISINHYLKFKIKQRTEQLLISKEVAEESNKLKTNFIDNIPYEIQTPMNGIIGLSEFLNDESTTEEERKKYTQMIIGSSKTLISIIDNILEVSKLQTKRATIKLTKTNLFVVFQNLLSLYETKATGKNIKIAVKSKIREEDNLVLIDRTKLKKILNPIVENAITYTDSGSIIITYEVKNESLVISVEDTGCGIKDRSQHQIRESLSQDTVVLIKDLKGLGFGLTIAKRNADFIGGEIHFSSIPDKGSIFTLTIPYTKSEKSTETDKSFVKNSGKKKKEKHIILIAEDVETNFLYLKAILSKMKPYDFVIYRAKNGKEAVTICEEFKNIDLVLMDIKMPIMNGYDATKYIKQMRPDLPIIAQTAYSVEEDIEKALEAGCDDFISKPVDKRLLSPMLKKYFSVLKGNS